MYFIVLNSELFFFKIGCQPWLQRLSFPCYLTHSVEKKRWIHTFPKCIPAKVNITRSTRFQIWFTDSLFQTITPPAHPKHRRKKITFCNYVLFNTNQANSSQVQRIWPYCSFHDCDSIWKFSKYLLKVPVKEQCLVSY